MITWFDSPQHSHAHSQTTLETLYQYDDFMASIRIMADMGCGDGLDLEWWATRTTRDEKPLPLNIRCVGIDRQDQLPMAHRYRNITFQQQDFETEPIHVHRDRFDLMWCHDSFQYVIDPFRTLTQWRAALDTNGMLILIVPQTTNLVNNRQEFQQRDFCYHHWSLVSLIHVLAVCGFDCQDGFFLKRPEDHWLHAVVYRSEHEPMDPRVTTWYELREKGLLPESAAHSVYHRGYLDQKDLVLRWLDRSMYSYHAH